MKPLSSDVSIFFASGSGQWALGPVLIRHVSLYIFVRADIKSDGRRERAGEYEERGFTLVNRTTASVITTSKRDKSNSVLAMNSRHNDDML